MTRSRCVVNAEEIGHWAVLASASSFTSAEVVVQRTLMPASAIAVPTPISGWRRLFEVAVSEVT